MILAPITLKHGERYWKLTVLRRTSSGKYRVGCECGFSGIKVSARKLMRGNHPEEHERLIRSLDNNYGDGWALSCSTPSLKMLLPMCPDDVRIAAWVKPFAIFKPNVNPAYAWEPVLFRGGRKRDRTQDTARDWHSENITLKKGLPGAKPPKFADWILALLGVDFAAGDTIDDLFPGTHGMTLAWKERREPSQLEIGAA